MQRQTDHGGDDTSGADKPFSVKLPPTLRQALDAVAAVRRTPTGVTLRWILDRWFEQPRGLTVRERAILSELLEEEKAS